MLIVVIWHHLADMQAPRPGYKRKPVAAEEGRGRGRESHCCLTHYSLSTVALNAVFLCVVCCTAVWLCRYDVLYRPRFLPSCLPAT